MSYGGHVVNGVVVLDKNIQLPEGAVVRVEVLPTSVREESQLAKSLLNWAGKGQDLPVDLAVNHDHYLHGLPKQ